MKFKSSRLKKFGYNIDVSFDEAKELKEIIALADSQMLRTIRDVRRRAIDNNKLELWFKLKKKLKKRNIKYNKEKLNYYQNIIKSYTNSGNNSIIISRLKQYIDDYLTSTSKQITYYQNKIYRTMFIPDYITVVMEHPTHYDYIYKNGVIINGQLYRRLSCGAGQARVSTVVLCNTDIIDEVRNRLNNNRDKSVPLAPNKFNAYFGLSSSATHLVSEPNFIVIKDFTSPDTFRANFVTETDWDKDDTYEAKDIILDINRFDGMGLISVEKSKQWADELGLDYIPAQWCIRQNFIKGMLMTFDIHEFCKSENNNSFLINTIYKDQNGNTIVCDLHDYDVILSESQFKLCGAFHSVDEYIKNCHENNLFWGVSQYTPKEPKNILTMNYQFLQTLNLNKQDVEKLASQFVEWINGVSYDNFAYTLLFLLGQNNTADSITKYLRDSDNYWIKSLIVNPELRNDPYIASKIQELIKTKIKNGCMGAITIDGNFQVLCSDPYAFMQHACNQEVTGLLIKDEFYSNYWNQRKVKKIDGMRSPLTFRAEHVVMNLVQNEKINKWYKYATQGIILNIFGHNVVNFGGADHDFDILATTSNSTVIKGVYKNELPVVYTPPKPDKKVFTEDDLYKADTFSFGSIIGSITNKSSNAYALLPNLEEEFGIESDEYKLTYSRLIQCCKAQSAQIDKAKIGREVKGIPNSWIDKQKIETDKDGVVLDNEETVQRKNMYNNILLNKYPYFFKYRYKDVKKSLNNYIESVDITCKQRFKMPFADLMKLERQTTEQKEFITNFYKYSPVTYSNSTMNLLCQYIESVNFGIKAKIKAKQLDNSVYIRKGVQYSEDIYDEIILALEDHIRGKHFDKLLPASDSDEDEYDELNEFQLDNSTLEERLNEICSNSYEVCNYLVKYFYEYKPKSNKDILWGTYGKELFNTVKRNSPRKVLFPLPDKLGEVRYLGETYSLQEIKI